MEGAHGVLLSISGGSDLGIFEINEAASMVADAAHPEANIIFGAIIDDALGDEVRVTVIAAGFDGGAPKHKPAEQQRREHGAERPPAPLPPVGSTTPTVTSRYGPPANAGVRGGSSATNGATCGGRSSWTRSSTCRTSSRGDRPAHRHLALRRGEHGAVRVLQPGRPRRRRPGRGGGEPRSGWPARPGWRPTT